MFQAQTYTNRRNVLKSKIKSGIILLLGNNDMPMNYPANTYHFRQDSSFLYFYGLNDPSLAAIIDVESGEEILFGNDVDIDDIIWMGPQPSVKERGMLCGMMHTKPFGELENYIKKNAASRKIHFLPPYRADNAIFLETLLGIKPQQQKDASSLELIKAIIDLRSIKEDVEIDEIEKAMEVAYLSPQE